MLNNIDITSILFQFFTLSLGGSVKITVNNLFIEPAMITNVDTVIYRVVNQVGFRTGVTVVFDRCVSSKETDPAMRIQLRTLHLIFVNENIAFCTETNHAVNRRFDVVHTLKRDSKLILGNEKTVRDSTIFDVDNTGVSMFPQVQWETRHLKQCNGCFTQSPHITLNKIL